MKKPEELAALLVCEISGLGIIKKMTLMVYAFPREDQIYLLLHATNPRDRRYKGHKGVLSLEQFTALITEIVSHPTERATLVMHGTQVTLKLSPPMEYIGVNHLTVTSDLTREAIHLRLKNRAEELQQLLAVVKEKAPRAIDARLVTLDL